MSLPAPYVDLSNRGLSWAPSIPSHWQIKRAKYLFNLEHRPVRDTDDVVTAFRDGEVTLRSKRRIDGFTNSEKEVGYQGVRTGDLVIHAMDAFAGAIGVSDADGKCTPVYSCCTPIGQVSTQFYARMLRTMALTGFIESLSKGVRERSTDFRWRELAEQRLPVPPLDEQELIASYIDRASQRLDGLIEKKRRFIELLREKRASSIANCVTKGLDASNDFQTSGLKSIGDVPSRWSISPIGRALRLTKRIVGADHASFKLLSLTTRGVIERDISDNAGKFPESFDTYQEVRPGQFVFCLFDIDETPRTVGCSENSGMITSAYAVFDCIEAPYARYLLYLFLHLDTCKGLKPFYTGLRKTIRPSKFKSIRIPFPPAAEAAAIAEHLDRQTSRIDLIISRIERSIELLKEHRSALITAAVTGKIDVRDTAAKDMKAAA